MKSPISGKEMIIRKEVREIEFRKEKFPVIFHFYFCEDSGEKFTNTKFDEINLNQLHNQFRVKHNLPFPEEIRKIREKYDLSANKMSEILGFGINSYRNYENGEVPSNSNGKLIQLASKPNQFKEIVKFADILDEDAKLKLIRKIDKILEIEREINSEVQFNAYLFDSNINNELTGYRKPNFDRFTEMIVYFSDQLKPWKTQLNKLLFYADFLSFKRSCFSISGARYRAIEMGPVPQNFNSIFEFLINRKQVNVSHIEFSNGSIGEQFFANPDRKFESSKFTQTELQVLYDVSDAFKNLSTQNIIDISHSETAWIQNEAERKLINYQFAFELEYLD